MIFVTLGSQKFQFDRLLLAVDRLIENGAITEETFAQVGYSEYRPVHYAFEDFMDRERFSTKMEEAKIVITHGGTGAIINAIKKRKKVIAVPRLAKYGEHVDNHQLQIVSQFKELGLICACVEVENLEKSLETVVHTDYKSYQSNTQRILDNIERFIET